MKTPDKREAGNRLTLVIFYVDHGHLNGAALTGNFISLPFEINLIVSVDAIIHN